MHKTQTQRQKKLLLLALPTLASLIYIILFFPPSFTLPIGSFQFPLVILFFALLFIFLFSATTFIFKSKKHGFLIGIFTLAYLLFRLNNLTHPFFFLLLLALFITLQLLFSQKNKP